MRDKTTAETVFAGLLGNAHSAVVDKLTGEERRTISSMIAHKYIDMLKEKADIWKFLTMLEKAALVRKGTGMADNINRAVAVIRGELKKAQAQTQAKQ